MNIKSVDKNNVSEQVYNQMISLIVNGKWLPGDKIPSENELKDMFNVSRNTVRGVMHKLNVLGLLETKSGEGTFIKKLGASIYINQFIPSIFLDKRDYVDVMEFRKCIEVEAAKLAALRATEENILKIQKVLQILAENKEDIEAYSRYDIDFHSAIAKACGNPMFEKIMDTIRHLLLSKLKELIILQGTAESMVFHHKILEAIKNGDAEKAGYCMNEHLSRVSEVIKIL